MLSYDQSPARSPAVDRNDSAAHCFDYASAPRLQYRVVTVKPDNQNVTAFLFASPFEKQNDSCQHDWFQFVRKKSDGNGWLGSWLHVEAGYGQFYQIESSIGKNTMEWQQPSCAYLRASFSF